MNDQKLPDEELMCRVARGDHAAFETLVSRHQRAVFQLAYRYLGSRENAEDAAQETFVRLFRAAVRYRPMAPFRSYLLTITARLCLNRKARFSSSREVSIEADKFEREPDRGLPNPEEGALRKERQRSVRKAVLALPGEQRMALVLCRFHELSYREVGEVMGKSVSAVTSLVWRAGERLRVTLQGLVEESSEDRRKDLPVRRFESSEAGTA